MERRWVQLENIFVGDRHRALDAKRVSEIARSIKDIGLMNPPAVRFKDSLVIDGEEIDNVPVLIAGRHRIAALKENGEISIECVVYDVDDLHAELMEIDENLARAELSPAQEAAHLKRRAEIWSEIHSGETGRISPSLGGRGKVEFAADVAAVVANGRNPETVKRDVNLKIARARALGPDLAKIAGTSLDKGVELDALAKLPEPERRVLITKAAAGETVSARPAATQPDREQAAQNAANELAEMLIDGLGKKRVPELITHLTGVKIKDLIEALRRAA